MARNFHLEGLLKEAAAAAGAREEALADFELDVQAFRITKAEEIPAWVERCKTEMKHRFAIQSDHDAELCHKAFVLKNKTAEGALYKSVSPDRFEQLKVQWANGVPESEKTRFNGSDHKNNPWAAIETNINTKTGRYLEDAIKRQMSCVRAMGPERAAETAAVVGARLGQIYAPGFANKGR